MVMNFFDCFSHADSGFNLFTFSSASNQELNLKRAEVEALLIDLILDQRLNGKIDQIEGFLILDGSKQTSSSKKHDALERWSESLRSLTSHVVDRVNW